MEKFVFHPAQERGHVNHGWLNAHHSFSFASWQHPEKVHFGALRVLNDDIVAPGMGFGTHPHDNMEIITIPLKGDLEHKDSMGNIGRIKENEIQMMSAGSGVTHSEYNPNRDREVNLLQIWIFPKERNIKPRYNQIVLNEIDRKNKFQQVISPDGNPIGMNINQHAFFQMANMDANTKLEYKIQLPGNGVYAFLIEGEIKVNDNYNLEKRDAIGLWETEMLSFEAKKDAQLLLIEVPMNF
ncbi:MAG TPA: pirin family protein [Bacteroidia bacterium]|nr:pirin family protein [Bacteroidia bacterium]